MFPAWILFFGTPHFFSRHLCPTFIMLYWRQMTERPHLWVSPVAALTTTFPPSRPLGDVPREISIKQQKCLRHFNLASTLFISAPFEPRWRTRASMDKAIFLFPSHRDRQYIVFENYFCNFMWMQCWKCKGDAKATAYKWQQIDYFVIMWLILICDFFPS